MSNETEITQLAPGMYAAGQLEIADIERAVTLGVTTIVCNRPDDEADQTSSTIIAAAAQVEGIRFEYLPMANPEAAHTQLERFKQVLTNSKVVLAYCRTGRRSSILWAESTK